MKSYNFQYSNYENLKEFINRNNIDKGKNILVQVFTGITNKDFIEEIIKYRFFTRIIYIRAKNRNLLMYMTVFKITNYL